MTQQERAEYCAAIRDMERQLGAATYPRRERPEDCVILTTVEKRSRGIKGGVAMEVCKRSAARQIVDGTHRLATDEEIEAYHADQRKRRADAVDLENRKNFRAVFIVSAPETVADSSLLPEAEKDQA